MANIIVGEVDKGSRHCLQTYMNENRQQLSRIILSASSSLLSYVGEASHIHWVSPLPQDNFLEYRDDFVDKIGCSIPIGTLKNKLRKFWPKSGPQWDGIASIKDGSGKNGLILVEAKAHQHETNSDLKAISKASIYQIEKALSEVQTYMVVANKDWTKQCYQLANRIAYLYFFNVELKIPTWLVLINFIEDESHKPTSLDAWLMHYNRLFSEMGISPDSALLDKIIIVYPPAINRQIDELKYFIDDIFI